LKFAARGIAALGALLGQQYFRHKTKKQPFRLLLWGAALVNILAVVLWWAYVRA